MGKSSRNKEKQQLKKRIRKEKDKQFRTKLTLINDIINYNQGLSSIPNPDFKYNVQVVITDEFNKDIFITSPKFASDEDLMKEVVNDIIPALVNRNIFGKLKMINIIHNEQQLNIINNKLNLSFEELGKSLDEAA